MRFGEHFRVVRGPEDDWFDPFLDNDTPLYPDAFEIYEDAAAEWNGAHDHLLDFFDIVLGLVKRSAADPHTQSWKKAERLLLFPEPAEFCLGLSQGSVRGSGSGPGLQMAMLEGAVEAVRRGIEKVEHMELLVLFGEGIGADRIGDITCNVLKSRFIRYTQSVVSRHSVPTSLVRVRHASWQPGFSRWREQRLQLPVNAMLNYAYAVLESQVRIAIAEVGLDPSIGYLHVCQQGRHSLVYDLMEPYRPCADREVLALVQSEVLTPRDSIIDAKGICRLHPGLAKRLAGLSTLSVSLESWLADLRFAVGREPDQG